MMEYIKKLRACIKWLLDREDANLAQIGKLNAELEAAEAQHAEKGTTFSSHIGIAHHLLFFSAHSFFLSHQLN
jgi:hypothetical protein